MVWDIALGKFCQGDCRQGAERAEDQKPRIWRLFEEPHRNRPLALAAQAERQPEAVIGTIFLLDWRSHGRLQDLAPAPAKPGLFLVTVTMEVLAGPHQPGQKKWGRLQRIGFPYASNTTGRRAQ
jgi:hypothetical protein